MHDPYVTAFTVRRPWPQRRQNMTGVPQRYWWPPMVTVWHVEPGGRDAWTVCRPDAHRWHPHHWRIQVHPVDALKRWLWTRCERCGGRFGWGESGFTHQFDSDGPRWFRGERGVHHGTCPSHHLTTQETR